MQHGFYTELNKKTAAALEKGKAFFVQPSGSFISPIYNTFTGLPFTGANYFNLRLSNDVNNTRHTEYVKMNEALSAKSEWFSQLPPGNRPRSILYREENAFTAPRYEFVMPTAELNQQAAKESNETKTQNNNYIPFQSGETGIKDFEKFVFEQCTNAVNASFANCAFRSNIREHELAEFKTTLINEIGKNPKFIAEIADRAYREVMDYHYAPFDKNSFIAKARDETSDEFRELRSAITGHLGNMYGNKKPSFNNEFNELARPLIVKIENLHPDYSNRHTVINRETDRFIKQNITEERPAAVLADVFAGTIVEKSVKLARAGEKIFAGLLLAASLVRSQNDMSRYRLPEHYSADDKIFINNRMFQGDDLHKILCFDHAPFAITGNGGTGIRDYQTAYRAEHMILGLNPKINHDEYRRDMTNNQALFFYNTVKQKTGAAVDSDTAMRIAGNIIAIQEQRGNTVLGSTRDASPRLFYAYLNQTIREHPHILDQAIAVERKEKYYISRSYTEAARSFGSRR